MNERFSDDEAARIEPKCFRNGDIVRIQHSSHFIDFMRKDDLCLVLNAKAPWLVCYNMTQNAALEPLWADHVGRFFNIELRLDEP